MNQPSTLTRKRIPVDFNAIARDGKIKVWLYDTQSAHVGELVELFEDAEEMEMPAVLSEVEGDFAYFDLNWQVALAARPWTVQSASSGSRTSAFTWTPSLQGLAVNA